MAVDNPIPVGWQRIVLIVLRTMFGLIFLGAGLAKLFGSAMMVQEFGALAPYGLGQWFRYLTGTLEIAGMLLLIWPRTVSIGAGLLTCVSVGAGIAQIAVLHKDFIHVVVFAALLGWIAYSYRGAMKDLT